MFRDGFSVHDIAEHYNSKVSAVKTGLAGISVKLPPAKRKCKWNDRYNELLEFARNGFTAQEIADYYQEKVWTTRRALAYREISLRSERYYNYKKVNEDDS